MYKYRTSRSNVTFTKTTDCFTIKYFWRGSSFPFVQYFNIHFSRWSYFHHVKKSLIFSELFFKTVIICLYIYIQLERLRQILSDIVGCRGQHHLDSWNIPILVPGISQQCSVYLHTYVQFVHKGTVIFKVDNVHITHFWTGKR